MVSFKPIPLHLLIHSVTYTPPEDEGDGGMGGSKPAESQEIKKVRFQPTRKKVTTTDNSEVYTTGILFIDRVNSQPYVNVLESGTITFRGRRLSIVQVKEAYDIGPEPHHLELMLQ